MRHSKTTFPCLLAALSLSSLAQTIPTVKGNVTLVDATLEPTSRRAGVHQEFRLLGALRNDAPFGLKAVQLELTPIGPGGQAVRSCNFGENPCVLTIFRDVALAPGTEAHFEEPNDKIFLDTSQTIASGRWSVKWVSYCVKYDVESPPVSDPRFEILSSFATSGIAFELRNTSSDFIEVDWDQSVYVDEDGKTSRLMRGVFKLDEKDRTQPNTVVPPGAKMQDVIFPVSHIQPDRKGKLSQVPLLADAVIYELGASSPTTPARDVTGKEIKIFLRLVINDRRQNIPVTFKVVNMSQ